MRALQRIARWLRLQWGLGPTCAIGGVFLAIQGMREMSGGQQ